MNRQPLPAVAGDGALLVRESIGLSHSQQVLTLELPEWASSLPEEFVLRDEATGKRFPAQKSLEFPNSLFVLLDLEAGQELHLQHEKEGDASFLRVDQKHAGNGAVFISNGRWEVELTSDHQPSPETDDGFAPGPIRRMRVGKGPWRGASFLDTRKPVRRISRELREVGSVRVVAVYRAEFGDGFYEVRLTFDAASEFVRLDESFRGASGDQVVWDFSGDSLPVEILRLDTGAGYTRDPLHYHYDRRLARLACWTQYSQLFDFSDGYALAFSEGDAVGFVALDGGAWRGNSHNFLEAWARRWLKGDASSRRLVPAGTKADSAPAPESVHARSGHRTDEHLCVEGWLYDGCRSVALVLANLEDLRPEEERPENPLGHFEEVPDRARYRSQQSLLRRISIRHGIFPLQDQLALAWSWPEEEAPKAAAHEPWKEGSSDLASEKAQKILNFLEARVFGFWEGSGSAYSNAVVCRRLAPATEEWELLKAHGGVTAEADACARVWFSFMTQLFHRDHYYPGPAAMDACDDALTIEPAYAGMANQNFFTDVFNVGGIAAQVFHRHPDAASWRERFGAMWSRQLDYHVYPESGVWEESHTYFHHVLFTVLPTLERRKRDGVADGFADPAFRQVVGSLLKTLSPRDACFDGWRHTVALGDHGVETKLYRPLYRQLAEHLAPHDPELAGRLAWAYRELGGSEEFGLASSPPPWVGEYVRGMGYFFRDRNAAGLESLMVLRCGQAWAHHHNDEGSLQFFAAGRAWIVDSAFSYPQKDGPRKVRAEGHSRWMPRDIHPLNYFWQFNRGWIVRQSVDEAYPFSVAHTPVIMAETPGMFYFPLRRPIGHCRVVVQLSADAFLIVDRSDLCLPQTVRFHVPVDATVVLGEAQPEGKESYLRLWSTLSLQEMPGRDAPTMQDEKFSTREIRADFEGDSPVPFLVMIEQGPSSLDIRKTAAGFVVRHNDFEMQYEVSALDRIVVRNLRASVEMEISCSA